MTDPEKQGQRSQICMPHFIQLSKQFGDIIGYPDTFAKILIQFPCYPEEWQYSD